MVEGNDDGLYVAKFRGAGQGPGALVAEVVVGELARALGLPVPDLVRLTLPAELSVAEPDPEIQDLLAASAGLNLGVDFLPGALPFTPAALAEIDPSLAADIVWLDMLTTNVDRTPRNPTLLIWHGRTWAIDHGAALYRQYGSVRWPRRRVTRFPRSPTTSCWRGRARSPRLTSGSAITRRTPLQPAWTWYPTSGSARNRRDAARTSSGSSRCGWPRLGRLRPRRRTFNGACRSAHDRLPIRHRPRRARSAPR